MTGASSGKAGAVLFITATDTSVGKTMISALLVDFLRRRGIGAGYQKWVATGCEGSVPEDLAAVTACSGYSPAPEVAVPYRFRLPASPHLAAEREDAVVEPQRLESAFSRARTECDLLVVEGVGGLLVPLNRQMLLADLVAELSLPALLVARSGLGTINHTLLSLEAMRSRGILPAGVVFSDEAVELPELIVRDNMQTIAQLGRVAVLGRLPRCPDLPAARRAFIPIGENILKLPIFAGKFPVA